MARNRRIRGIYIPKQLLIRGRLWKVHIEPELPAWTDGAASMSEQGLMGITHRDRREIHLSGKLDERQLAETFVHELLHAVLPTTVEVAPAAYEERLVNAAAPQLLKILPRLCRRPRARPGARRDRRRSE